MATIQYFLFLVQGRDQEFCGDDGRLVPLVTTRITNYISGGRGPEINSIKGILDHWEVGDYEKDSFRCLVSPDGERGRHRVEGSVELTRPLKIPNRDTIKGTTRDS